MAVKCGQSNSHEITMNGYQVKNQVNKKRDFCFLAIGQLSQR